MKIRPICYGLIATSALFLGGCSFPVSVNERVVYTPPSLFSQYEIADSALARCVQQTIVDLHVTKARDLTRLNCSNAGITQLAGLEVFNQLQELHLGQNAITDASPLAALSKLKLLNLSENNILSAAPLLKLSNLTHLDLSNNAQLACADLRQLAKNYQDQTLAMLAPAQCQH